MTDEGTEGMGAQAQIYERRALQLSSKLEVRQTFRGTAASGRDDRDAGQNRHRVLARFNGGSASTHPVHRSLPGPATFPCKGEIT